MCAVTANQPIHKIYLPKGTWYNMWNDEKNAGNQEIFVEIPQNKIPVYVRAGEMLLLQSLTQHTQETPSDTLEWHIYYATEGEYRLQYYAARVSWLHLCLQKYDPDRHTKQGSYVPTTIVC